MDHRCRESPRGDSQQRLHLLGERQLWQDRAPTSTAPARTNFSSPPASRSGSPSTAQTSGGRMTLRRTRSDARTSTARASAKRSFRSEHSRLTLSVRDRTVAAGKPGDAGSEDESKEHY